MVQKDSLKGFHGDMWVSVWSNIFITFFFLMMITYVLLDVTGVTRIGREDAPVPQDITIQGPGIEAEHCLIFNEG